MRQTGKDDQAVMDTSPANALFNLFLLSFSGSQSELRVYQTCSIFVGLDYSLRATRTNYLSRCPLIEALCQGN